MKFACESCNTKYVIPDERVFARILRVRCKRCSNVMEVVGPSRSATKAEKIGALKQPQDMAQDRPLFSAARQGSDPFAQVSNSGVWGVQGAPRTSSAGGMAVQSPSLPRAVPAPSSEPMWWMAIKGDARGPFTVDEVEVLAARGRIHQKTRVWRPGMQSWLRLREVGELGHIKAPERTTAPGASEMTPAAGSSLPPPIPETAPLTPIDRPFANLLSSQPPPPFPDNVQTGELTPPPLSKTGGTGWYVLSDQEAAQLFDLVEDAPQHVPGTSALMTGSHIVRRNTPRVVYAVVGAVMLAAVCMALAIIPDLLLQSDETTAMIKAPVRAPVSNKPVIVESKPEDVEKLRALAIPRVTEQGPTAVETAPSDTPRGTKVGNLKKALTREAQKLLKD